MFHSAINYTRRFGIRLTSLPVVILLVTVFLPDPMCAQVVASYDFEDGTAQGWTSFNGAGAPVNSTAAAFTGTHSLLTTTNSSGAGGPGISMSSLLLPGATYTITGHVMLTTDEASTDANFTMKRTDASCSGWSWVNKRPRIAQLLPTY